MSGTKRWSVYDPFDHAGPLRDFKPIWTPSLLSLFEGLPIPDDPDIELWYPDPPLPYVSGGRAFMSDAWGSSSLPGMSYAYYGSGYIRRALEAGLVPVVPRSYGAIGFSGEKLQEFWENELHLMIHNEMKFLSPYASSLVTDLEFSRPSRTSLQFLKSGGIIHGNAIIHADPLAGVSFETDGLFIGLWTHAHGFYTNLPFLPGGSWLNSTLEVHAAYISRSPSPPPSSLSSFAGPFPTSAFGSWFNFVNLYFPGHYVWGSTRILTYFLDSGNLSEVGWQASNGIVNLKMPWTSGSSLVDLGSGELPYRLPPPLVPGKAIFVLFEAGGAFADVTQNTNTLNWNNFCSQIPSSGAGSYSFDRFIPAKPSMTTFGLTSLDIDNEEEQLASVSSFKMEVDIPQGGKGGKGGWHVGGIAAGAGGAGGSDGLGLAGQVIPDLLGLVYTTVFSSTFRSGTTTGVLPPLNDYFNLV